MNGLIPDTTNGLAAQAQTLDQLPVSPGTGVAEVPQQSAAAAHHRQQASPRREILVMSLEVLGQPLDPRGQDGDLHFARAHVGLVGSIRGDNLFLRLRL